MPIELDKGHDKPIFGPHGKLNMAERFELANEIVRKYGRRAKRLVATARVRRLITAAARRSRPRKRK